ncbi:hypothetical protein ULG90_11190 [Halopseudomonas pachastrellae]|nr:hypothetical protein ULG90_11190 [Halopseudomonas pachastrellae]
MVFEGSDAAGKGGTIRRITQCLDPRILRVHGTSAHHRRRTPHALSLALLATHSGAGQCGGLTTAATTTAGCWSSGWKASAMRQTGKGPYGEINDFEQQLSDSGTLVIKFWLAITEEEQLKRFKALRNHRSSVTS